MDTEYTGFEVAVIGMAGRFPQAENVQQFWENLAGGKECVAFSSDEELLKAGLSMDFIENPSFVKSKGCLLSERETFDASFFEYLPAEAEALNPQTRFLHECVWHALEDAGYRPDTYANPIGLYLGATANRWSSLLPSGDFVKLGAFATDYLSSTDYTSTLISYKLNLKGPAVFVNTACSTSLVAIHSACQSLLLGDCQMAIAGGVSVHPVPGLGYMYEEGMVSSRDGHCRAFDADASGAIAGEGGGVVVLKLLEDAIADGDHIYAVIKGTAVNNDGKQKVGFTAPAIKGQSAVIRKAHNFGKIPSSTISYVEAHGTGTELGDVIELESLRQAFNTDKKNYCAIGSVKTNIGHLDAAAGVAGFIKTVLCLQHGHLVASLNYEHPNPRIDFSSGPFYVNTSYKSWERRGGPLRAGVSSFGIGGTNAHVVLEEAPEQAERAAKEQDHLLLLSARSASSLDAMSAALADHLEAHADLNLGDVSYTLQVGRKEFGFRRKLLCRTRQEAIAELRGKSGTVEPLKQQAPELVFLFSGLGSHYPGMCRDLYDSEPFFRQELEYCFTLVRQISGLDLKEILYGERTLWRGEDIEQSQYVLFSIEYSLARLLLHWGLKPAAVAGYSFGEYAAACIAGVFSVEEGIRILHKRAELLGAQAQGAMLSIGLTAAQTKEYLTQEELYLAIDNGDSCVVSGSGQAIEELEARLQQERQLSVRVGSDRALHTPQLKAAGSSLRSFLAGIKLQEPRIAFMSNVSGNWAPAGTLSDGRYWEEQLTRCVQFNDCLSRLLEEGTRVFAEIGPGSDLSVIVRRRQQALGQRQSALNLVRPPAQSQPDERYLLNRLGQLWLQGISPDWTVCHAGRERRRVPLPGYCFEKVRYWKVVDDYEQRRKTGSTATEHDPQQWLYTPSWKRRRNTAPVRKPGGRILLFGSHSGAACALTSALLKSEDCILVSPSAGYSKISAQEYTISATHAADYARLLAEVCSSGSIDRVVYLWPLSQAQEQDREELISRSFYQLLDLGRSLGESEQPAGGVDVYVITNHLQEVTGTEIQQADKALSLGLSKVLAQEYPRLKTVVIDLEGTDEQCAAALKEELSHELSDSTLSYRNGVRWVEVFPRLIPPVKGAGNPLVKEQGVYVVIGGGGRIGYALSQGLAARYHARLVIVGRRSVPARELWEQLSLTGDGPGAVLAGKLLRLEALSRQAVSYYAADFAAPGEAHGVLASVLAAYGRIDGFIHAADDASGDLFDSVSNLGADVCARQLRSKVQGLPLLERAIGDLGIKSDFGLVFSSLSSQLGGLGFGAYASANSYADAYVRLLNRRGSFPWLVSCWEGSEASHLEPVFTLLLGEGITDATVFSIGGRLEERLAQWLNPGSSLAEAAAAGDEAATEQKSATTGARPDLSSAYVAARTETEAELVRIWENYFGMSPIGVKDDLFELGGDSLKAINILSIIHRELNIRIPVKEFLLRSTIENIALLKDNLQTEMHEPILPAGQKDFYPLSPAQKRLYVLQQLDPLSTGYNSPTTIDLGIGIDKEKLEHAFNQLIARHEILRTSFEMVDDMPVQVIHDELTIRFEEYQCSREEVQNLSLQFVKPFQLDQLPLVRVVYITMENGEQSLIVDMHHIITDGVSHVILENEIKALYNGEELPVLALQYKDYSEWINSESQQQRLSEEKKYWLGVFSDEVPVLELPADYPRPLMQGFEGATVFFRLDAAGYETVKRICREERVTLYTCLLSIVSIWLSKLSGSADIVIGSPVAARPHADLEKIIGMFVNTLAIRSFPGGEKTYREFLHEINDEALQAFSNQEYPFEDLVKEISVNRDMSRNPVFDVMFSLDNNENPGDEKTITGRHEKSQAKFDLTMEAREYTGSILLSLEYCTDLFRPETIERFIAYFRRLLNTLSSGLDIPLNEIGIIDEEEERRLLYEFNDTENSYPADKTFCDLFAGQAAKTPGSVAVISGDESLTYAELNRQSNQLARCLIEKQKGAGNVIALMLDRGPSAFLSLLAVMKAGAAYLPVDPGYPAARKNYMVEDSGSSLLIDEQVFRTLTEESKQYPDEDFEFFSKPGEPAYVIYTSGSTGNPKGVIVEHRSMVNIGLGWKKEYRLDTMPVRVLQVASFSFDVFTGDYLRAFLNGGTLVICPAQIRADVTALYELLHSQQISLFESTPGLIFPLMEYIHDSKLSLPELKLLIAGSDLVTTENFNRLAAWFGNSMRIVNSYGVTEATIDSSFYEYDPQKSLGVNVPIGKPLHNVQMYILDKALKPVPAGTKGELYIGGHGVARGYINNPSLTAERFIANPYRPGERMYRTGDIARWLPDGNVEYLGRADEQVKIRGYRVETGEIEAQLQSHPAVHAAVVAVKGAGGNTLCAYYVSAKDIENDELLSYLQDKLPAYMIPSHFIRIENVPLTSNEKVDRKALPDPAAGNERNLAPPRNEMEEKLVEIWCSVLGLPALGIEDNYFALGGDSIKTIQIASRLRKLGYKLDISDIFVHPTISVLSPKVKKLERLSDQSAVSGEIPLSPAQHLLFRHPQEYRHHYNQSMMLFSGQGFDREALVQIFSRLLEHHDALRCVYREENGRVIQLNLEPGQPLSLEEFDLRDAVDPEEAVRVKSNEVQASLNLHNGPLLKLALFRTNEGDHLLIVIHHLVIDGVSWRILFEDIETLYEQYTAQQPFVLPYKTDSFRLWMERQSEYANSAAFLSEKKYWAEIAKKNSGPIPADMQGPNRFKDAQSVVFSLSAERTTQLLTESNKAYNTEINDILLAALSLSAKAAFGRENILVALEGHGREQIGDLDISRTVGWFTSTYPVLLAHAHATDPGRHIKETKEMLRAIPGKGIGYGILRYLTSAENKQDCDLSCNPQISFNYLGQMDSVTKEQAAFGMSSLPQGERISGELDCDYEIEVSGIILNNRLEITIAFSRLQYREETILRFADSYRQALEQLILHCAEKKTADITPSDLNYKGLSIEQLDSLFE